MKKIAFYCQAALLCLFSTHSLAGFECLGKLQHLAILSDGAVYIALGGSQIHPICNINTQGAYLMSAASCKMAYATLLSAKLAGSDVHVTYDYGNTTGKTCSTLPAWAAAFTAYYVYL